MTTQPLRPPIPPYLQPNPKASSTAQSSNLSAVANTTPAASRSSSQARPAKQRQNVTSPDFSSDAATLSLIRRVLSPQASHAPDQRGTPGPIEDLLPPLTSSNEVDIQLYAIIAIVLKEFVYVWYSKITPDHGFVEEVIQIIAHCTRALEQRLRRIDVEQLLLDEIPALVVAHIQAYQTAHKKLPSSAYRSTPARTYHALNPHPALSPVPDSGLPETCEQQAQNEAVYRQLLAQGTLAVLLPTEDLENSGLRTLVGDVISDLVLGQGISGKACQGWFVHDAIAKVAEIIKDRIEPKTTGQEIKVDTRSRLEHYGLLTSKDEKEKLYSPAHSQSRLSTLFWKLLQYVYLASLFVRFVVTGLSQARYLPPRSQHTKSSSTPVKAAKSSIASTPQSSLSQAPSQTARPIMEYRIFPAISTVLDLSTRMPWLAGSLSLCQHFTLFGLGRVGSTDSVLDK